MVGLLIYTLATCLLVRVGATFALVQAHDALRIDFCMFLSATYLFLRSFRCTIFTPLAFLVTVSRLFDDCRSPCPTKDVFRTFFFVKLKDLLFPRLLCFMPLFCLKVVDFESLSLGDFFTKLAKLYIPC